MLRGSIHENTTLVSPFCWEILCLTPLKRMGALPDFMRPVSKLGIFVAAESWCNDKQGTVEIWLFDMCEKYINALSHN